MAKKILGLLIWILSFQAIGFLLGLVTQCELMTWYASLHKSSLTPPDLVFAVVWPILYVMIAISGWSLWEQRQQPGAPLALGFYGAQVLMNWSWTPLFFHFHLIKFSFYWSVGIATLTLITIVLCSKRFKLAMCMLLPYVLWMFFACYLNYIIWVVN